MAGRPTLETPHQVGLMPKTVPWKTADLVQNAFTMPLTRPSFPRAPYLYRQPRASHHVMTDYTDRRS
jgi:hypothetical protein